MEQKFANSTTTHEQISYKEWKQYGTINSQTNTKSTPTVLVCATTAGVGGVRFDPPNSIFNRNTSIAEKVHELRNNNRGVIFNKDAKYKPADK
jgi:hypothetical protein